MVNKGYCPVAMPWLVYNKGEDTASKVHQLILTESTIGTRTGGSKLAHVRKFVDAGFIIISWPIISTILSIQQIREKGSVTIQLILPRSAMLDLVPFHKIRILALKKQGQCLRGGHALLATC